MYYQGIIQDKLSMNAFQTAGFIKSKREAMGLTQKEFAELLGIGDAGDRTVRGTSA